MFSAKTTQDTILRAAMTRFASYGYKRTSLSDIADEAGVSRPTLYTYFKNKAAILEAVSQGIYDTTLANIEAALATDLDLETQLADAFYAWVEPFIDILFGSPHGAELIGASNALTGEISIQAKASFQKLLVKRLNLARRTSEIDLAASDLTSAQAAEFLILALNGLSTGKADEQTHKKRLQTLARLFLTRTRSRS